MIRSLSICALLVACLTVSQTDLTLYAETDNEAEPKISPKAAIRGAVFTGDRELAERLHKEFTGALDIGCLAGLGLTKELTGRLQHHRHLVHTLNPDYPGKHMTPLHAAAMNGREETVVYLLELGAGPSVPSEYGFTPLHLAVRHGHRKIAELLIEKGANINATTVELKGGSVSVFLEAMKNHDLALISLLDELGVEPIRRNSHHLDLVTAGRLITFSRWISAGEEMSKDLSESVDQEVDANPPLWTHDLKSSDGSKRKLRAFKLGDGYHRRISVVLILTNEANQVLSSASFVTSPFSMNYTDAHIEPDLQETEEGTVITLRFVNASIHDWLLRVRISDGQLQKHAGEVVNPGKAEE